MRQFACLFMLMALVRTGGAGQTTADEAWNTGDHATAERLYLEKLATDSTDLLALHRVALIHGWSERYESSVRYFDQLLLLQPSNARAEVDRARILGWSKRYDEALASLESLIERSPDNLDALRLRAQIAGWAGELTDAIATYDRILELVPGDTEVTRNQARTLTWASRHDEALQIYADLLAREPDNRETLLGVAQLLAWSGRLDSAAAIYDSMLSETPGDTAALRGRARVASWAGDLGKGEDHWRSILRSQPNDVEAMVGLSQTLRWQGRHGAALDILDRAKTLDPTNPEVLTQERWTRASVGPRFTGTITYEGDSDGNRILTNRIRAGFRPLARIEITANAYRRRAGFDSRFLPKRTSDGFSGTVWAQFEPGWNISATAGTSESNALTATPIGTFQVALNSPVRERIAFTGTYVRAAFDYTAPLMDQGVFFREYKLITRILLPRRVTLRVTGARATFEGTVGNRRLQTMITLSKRVSTPITLGGNLQIFGFRDDLDDGYFDPNFFALLETTGNWQRTFSQRWTLQAELAPGLQKIQTDGKVGATVRSVAGISYGILPGRQISVQGLFTSTGIRSFSSSPGTYRYRAITFSGSWRF